MKNLWAKNYYCYWSEFVSPTGCAKKFYPLCRIKRYHQPNFYISPEF